MCLCIYSLWLYICLCIIISKHSDGGSDQQDLMIDRLKLYNFYNCVDIEANSFVTCKSVHLLLSIAPSFPPSGVQWTRSNSNITHSFIHSFTIILLETCVRYGCFCVILWQRFSCFHYTPTTRSNSLLDWGSIISWTGSFKSKLLPLLPSPVQCVFVHLNCVQWLSMY